MIGAWVLTWTRVFQIPLALLHIYYSFELASGWLVLSLDPFATSHHVDPWAKMSAVNHTFLSSPYLPNSACGTIHIGMSLPSNDPHLSSLWTLVLPPLPPLKLLYHCHLSSSMLPETYPTFGGDYSSCTMFSVMRWSVLSCNDKSNNIPAPPSRAFFHLAQFPSQ